jgi:hypothetical protein
LHGLSRSDGWLGRQEGPVLTRAKGKPRLSTLDHWGLLLAYLLRFGGWVDVHAGYFSGKLSQQLIYRLACLGFDGLLEATYDHGSLAAPDAWSEAVRAFSEECKRSGIRILLSPVRVPQRRELEKQYKMAV